MESAAAGSGASVLRNTSARGTPRVQALIQTNNTKKRITTSPNRGNLRPQILLLEWSGHSDGGVGFWLFITREKFCCSKGNQKKPRTAGRILVHEAEKLKSVLLSIWFLQEENQKSCRILPLLLHYAEELGSPPSGVKIYIFGKGGSLATMARASTRIHRNGMP